MGYYNDISNSEYAAKDTALANRLNGVSGHNPWAVLGLNATMQLTNYFTNASSNGNANVPEEKADDNWASNTTSSIKQYNKLLTKFKSNSTQENWNKLEQYYNEHKDDSSTIKLPQRPKSFS